MTKLECIAKHLIATSLNDSTLEGCGASVCVADWNDRHYINNNAKKIVDYLNKTYSNIMTDKVAYNQKEETFDFYFYMDFIPRSTVENPDTIEIGYNYRIALTEQEKEEEDEMLDQL